MIWPSFCPRRSSEPCARRFRCWARRLRGFDLPGRGAHRAGNALFLARAHHPRRNLPERQRAGAVPLRRGRGLRGRHHLRRRGRRALRGGRAQRLLIRQRPPQLPAQQRHRRPRVGTRRPFGVSSISAHQLTRLCASWVYSVFSGCAETAPARPRPHVREDVRSAPRRSSSRESASSGRCSSSRRVVCASLPSGAQAAHPRASSVSSVDKAGHASRRRVREAFPVWTPRPPSAACCASCQTAHGTPSAGQPRHAHSRALSPLSNTPS